MKPPVRSDMYLFSDYCLDRRTQTLCRNGERISLAPKATKLLLLLLENAPSLVSRDEIRTALWGDSTYIEFEGALNACVRQVRAALGDSARKPRFIETMPKRGYRFVAEMKGRPPTPVPHRKRATVVIAVVAATVVLAALFFPWSSGTVAPKLLVILPAQGESPDSLDPIAGYGVAVIASAHMSDLTLGQLSVVNSSSLRKLSAGDRDMSTLKSPDYVVHTRILEQDNEFVVNASLLRGDNGEVLSTLSEALDVDATTAVRKSPEIIVRWLSGALKLGVNHESTAAHGNEDHDWSNDLVAAFWQLEADTAEGARAALDKFNQALRIRPMNRWASEGKLRALAYLTFSGNGTPDAERAFVELENTAQFMFDNSIYSARGYEAMGFVRLFRDWEVSAAINLIETALLIEPDSARIHSLYASALAATGDTGAAVGAAEMAERLDPATMFVRSDRCWFLIFDQRYEEATDVCASIAKLEPLEMTARLGHAHAQALLGNKNVALRIMVDSIRLVDDGAFEGFTAVPTTWEELGCLRVAEIMADGNRRGVMHYQIARYYAQCGKPAETLSYLKLSVDQREVPALFMRSAEEFELLHDDPEYRQLQRLLP